MEMKGRMEHYWNNTDRGEPKKLRSILSQCHYVHHKSHMDFPGIERMAWPRAVESHLNFIKKFSSYHRENRSVFTVEISCLLQLRTIMMEYSEIHTRHTNTLRGYHTGSCCHSRWYNRRSKHSRAKVLISMY